MTIMAFPAFVQEFQSVNKNPIENSFNTRYLGPVGTKHFVLNFNENLFRNEAKDIDQDKITKKPELKLAIFDEQGALQKTVTLMYEYKFQELLFAGIIDNNVSLIYSSNKAKGTVVENFDSDGNKLNFQIISDEKKKNFIKVSDSNKFILHIAKEYCYVYDRQLKNIDKFLFATDSIIDVINYQDGFLMLHRKDNIPEILQFSPSTGLKKHQHKVSKTWICKSPRINIDAKKTNRFYLSFIIGKTIGQEGGWSFYDTRLDVKYRSKGVQIVYFDGIETIKKDRSILFESNIIYGTNPNANAEQNMGCTNLSNKGVFNFENSLLFLLEEQLMNRTETINQLTGAKKVSHKFKYHDIIFVKIGEMTSIQNFLIKACETKMNDNTIGSFIHYQKGNKLNILYNQTYIRENKHKLLNASLDMYLERENKSLLENFNQQELNVVLNPLCNYAKSKYFLALHNGFIDLILLEK